MPMPSQIDIRIQSDIRVKFDQMVYECDGNGIGGICTVSMQDRQRGMPQRHNQRQPSHHGQPSPDRVHSAPWQSHFSHSRIPHLPLLMYLASRQSQLVFRFASIEHHYFQSRPKPLLQYSSVRKTRRLHDFRHLLNHAQPHFLLTVRFAAP